METVPAGYDVGTATVYSYQRPLDFPQKDALTCVKCKLILRDPKQVIVCGHRYCKLCIEQMTSGRYREVLHFGCTHVLLYYCYPGNRFAIGMHAHSWLVLQMPMHVQCYVSYFPTSFAPASFCIVQRYNFPYLHVIVHYCCHLELKMYIFSL